MKIDPRYDASSIEVLSGLEAIRRRPAMYIGSTDAAGLHHLVFEVVENAVDESLAGYCKRIAVVLHADGSCSVEDDGRGIPMDPHPETGRPAGEVVLTTLHSGAKFRKGAYQVSGGLHGVGVSCVNALSEWLVLDVWSAGGERRSPTHFRERFVHGAPEADVAAEPLREDRTGTRLHFLPDRAVFAEAGDLQFDRLARRLEQLAFLHPGLQISIKDERTKSERLFDYERGLVAFVKHLNVGRRPLHAEPIHLSGHAGSIEVEVALQWTQAYQEELQSFVNSIHTQQGGTHLDGLKAALTQGFHRFASASKLLDDAHGETFSGFDLREGLAAVLSVRMPEPHFGGQTKSQLTNREVGGIVGSVVEKGLTQLFASDPSLGRLIVGKAIEASRARVAARRASERASYVAVDPTASAPIYQKQFGIRSKNWHDSCVWLTHDGILKEHVKHLDVPKDAVLLDVCCGSGVVGASFRGKVKRIVGLDLTPEMRALAATRLDHVDAGNIYDLPYDDDTFDAVCTREVLHLFPEPERPLAQIHRVLKPGGQFIVGQILPFGPEDSAWMFRVFKKKQPLLFNQWLDHEYVAFLESVGFEDVRMSQLEVWESIDVWIDTWETTSLHRHEIRELFYNAPEEVRRVHPFEVAPDGTIRDCWRWCVFSARKRK
jgi:DNA gyrase subunit B